jgi:23S rRNA (guanosine2251-2'-O)-methyltransferase
MVRIFFDLGEGLVQFHAGAAGVGENGLLESPYPVEALLLTPDWLERIRPLLDARPDLIRVFLARQKSEIEQITGFSSYQGIKAVGRIPAPVHLEPVIRSSPTPRLFAALDGLSNAENLGVIVRNAAALGVHALVIGETSCSPFLTRAIRTSMGAVFRLPAVENLPLLNALALLRQAGVRCIAAHPAANAIPSPAADFTHDCCIVLGSEGYGISPAVLEACTERTSIPMANQIDSLNVSSAAGILFYEAWRQRHPSLTPPPR